MKETVKKPYFILLTAALVLAIAAAVTRTVLVLTALDPTLGHFEPSAATDILWPLLIILSVVFCAVFSIVIREELREKKPENTLPTVFASAFAAISAAVWAGTQAFEVFRAEGLALPFGILMLLCAVGLILYFITAVPNAAASAPRITACLSAVLFCTFYLLYSYFDTSFTLNSPVKIFDQLTFIALTVFFLAECRFLFGKLRFTLYAPAALIAATLSLTSALPALVYRIAEERSLIGTDAHAFLMLAFFLYAAARLAAAVERPRKEEAPCSAYEEEIREKAEAALLSVELPLTDPNQEVFDIDGTDTNSSDDSDGDTDDGN